MRLSLAGLLGLAAAAPAAGQPIELPDIVISANRTPTAAEATGATVSVLTEPSLAADGRPLAIEQIATLPGVSVQQNGPAGTVSGFTLRGAPQQYVRVLVDGIEISDPTAPQVTPSLSGLLTDDISRIEVLQGSQSALYGGQAVAGVIDITSPRPTENGIENRLLLEGGAYSSFRGRYALSGRSDRGDFALTIARLQSDGFSAAEEADGNTEDDGYATTRLSASGTFYATDTVSLFGTAFWQTEDGDFDGTDFATGQPIDAPNTYDGTNWGARAGIDFLALDGRLQNRLAVSYFDIDRTNSTYDPAATRSDYETDGYRTRLEYLGKANLTDSLALQFGADWTREVSRSTYASTGFVSDSASMSNEDTGVFAQADWSPVEALTVNAAIRQDEHSEFGGHTTGRLTAAYLLPSDTILRASLGTGFRAPSNYELFDAYSGNPDLDPETSQSADIGVEQRFAGDRGKVSATWFWLKIDDLIDYDYTTNRYIQIDGTADSQGLELTGAWALTDALTLSGNYTYTDARLPDGRPRNRVPRHEVNLALDGDATDRLGLGLGLRYVADYVDDSGQFATNGFESSFLVANARVSWAVTDQAQLYVRAENLFDQQYQTARGYGTSDRAFYFGVTGTF